MKQGKTVSECVIGCAFEVSNTLGAGFLEAVYENALCYELETKGIVYERQKPLTDIYERQKPLTDKGIATGWWESILPTLL